MTVFWLVSSALLWALVLLLGFLLLGALRAQGLLVWRLDQLEATMPSRIGRSGLAPGRKAPDFSLAGIDGAKVSLDDFAGRRVLLVFVQSGCGPCHEIVPELNKLVRKRCDLAVLAINHSRPEDAARWADETRVEFPVLIQEDLRVSKRYEALATPFAFFIDERSQIIAKGIVSQRHHLGYVLSSVMPQVTKPKNGPFASPVEDESQTSEAVASR